MIKIVDSIGDSARKIKEKVTSKTKKVKVSKSKYPESYEHAQSTGNATGPFIKDTANAKSRRRQNLKGTKSQKGKDRDEWPPAQTV